MPPWRCSRGCSASLHLQQARLECSVASEVDQAGWLDDGGGGGKEAAAAAAVFLTSEEATAYMRRYLLRQKIHALLVPPLPF